MKSYEKLPNGYNEICTVKLEEKKLASKIAIISSVIALLMAIPAGFTVPISTVFGFENIKATLVKIIMTMISVVVYIILHELTHAVAMKICGTKNISFGVNLKYAYTGSDEYYDKKAYIFIALAPVVLWGIVLSVICVLAPLNWFWVAYFTQIMNLSGATGDYYVTLKFLKMPKDILIRDYGTEMKVFSK